MRGKVYELRRGKEVSDFSDKGGMEECGKDRVESGQGESSSIDYQGAIVVSTSGRIRAESNRVENTHTFTLASKSHCNLRLIPTLLSRSRPLLSGFRPFLSLLEVYQPLNINNPSKPIVLSDNKVPVVPSPLTTNRSESTDN